MRLLLLFAALLLALARAQEVSPLGFNTPATGSVSAGSCTYYSIAVPDAPEDGRIVPMLFVSTPVPNPDDESVLVIVAGADENDLPTVAAHEYRDTYRFTQTEGEEISETIVLIAATADAEPPQLYVGVCADSSLTDSITFAITYSPTEEILLPDVEEGQFDIDPGTYEYFTVTVTPDQVGSVGLFFYVNASGMAEEAIELYASKEDYPMYPDNAQFSTTFVESYPETVPYTIAYIHIDGPSLTAGAWRFLVYQTGINQVTFELQLSRPRESELSLALAPSAPTAPAAEGSVARGLFDYYSVGVDTNSLPSAYDPVMVIRSRSFDTDGDTIEVYGSRDEYPTHFDYVVHSPFRVTSEDEDDEDPDRENVHLLRNPLEPSTLIKTYVLVPKSLLGFQDDTWFFQVYADLPYYDGPDPDMKYVGYSLDARMSGVRNLDASGSDTMVDSLYPNAFSFYYTDQLLHVSGRRSIQFQIHRSPSTPKGAKLQMYLSAVDFPTDLIFYARSLDGDRLCTQVFAEGRMYFSVLYFVPEEQSDAQPASFSVSVSFPSRCHSSSGGGGDDDDNDAVTAMVVVAVILGLLALGLIGGVIAYLYKKRRERPVHYYKMQQVDAPNASEKWLDESAL